MESIKNFKFYCGGNIVNIKNLKIIIVLLIFLCSALPVSSKPLAVWIEGTVTRSPKMMNGNYYVMVNDHLYRILPDIRISYRYKRDPGAYSEKPAYVSSILKGQKIMIKVKHEDIYQIILF